MAALCACDLTLPWSSKAGPPFPIEFAPSSIALSAYLGEPAPSRDLLIRGVPSGLQVSVAPSTSMFQVDALPPSGGSLRYRVSGIYPVLENLGHHGGAVEIRVTSGWPHSTVWGVWEVPITYDVGPVSVTMRPDPVVFDYVVGTPFAEETLEISGPADAGPWSLETPFWITAAPSSGPGTPALVTLRASATYIGSDTITVDRRGARVPLAVTFQPRAPRFTPTPDALSFQVVQGEAPSQVALGVLVELNATASVNCEVSYGPEGSDWLGVPAVAELPGTIWVVPSRTDLPPGHYTSRLRCLGTSYDTVGFSVPVSMDISPAVVVLIPPSLTFQLGPATVAADLHVGVGVAAPGDAASWTATTDQPWLEVSPAAGTSPAGGQATLTVSILPAAAAAAGNGAYAGQVLLRYGAPGGRTLVSSIPVALAVDLPSVQAVGPPYDVAGNGAEVVIIGDGLANTSAVEFGSQPAAAFRILGPREIRATPPALAVGSHAVTLPTALGLRLGAGAYRVESSRAIAAAILPSTGQKTRLVFDERTGFLWAANPGAGAIERYSASAGWARDALALPGLEDAVLAPDGTSLLAVVALALQTVDATALTVGSTGPGPGGWDSPGFSHRMSSSLDGLTQIVRAPPVSGGLFVYSPSQHLVLDLGFAYGRLSMLAESRSRRGVAMAGDFYGSAWVWKAPLADTGYGIMAMPMVFLSTEGATSAALDRHGDTILFLNDGTRYAAGSTLLDESGTQRAGPLPPSIVAASLSQDGGRAVAFDGTSRRVRIFDLRAVPDPVSGFFPELGPAGGFAPAADPGAHTVMSLSADDRALFLGGDLCIAVVPLP